MVRARMPAIIKLQGGDDVRVEGPGKALEFNPSRDVATGQNAGERVRDDKSREALDKGSPGQVNREQLDSAAEILNRAMEVGSFGLQFRVHEDSGQVQVKVVDSETKEVIREIPPEQMLNIAAQIKEMLNNLHDMVGVLVNELV
jgi:flagellar protein FlaG